MTSRRRLWAAAAVVVVAVLAVAGWQTWHRQPAARAVNATCHADADGRPDRLCTPGVTNPDVTQETVPATICRPGWTATIRPPASYTNRLKKTQIKAYGYADTSPASYEEDHLLPLSLGGAPRDPRNLWPEPRPHAARKDVAEVAAKTSVCTGGVSLAAAQAAFLAAWGPTP